MIGETHSVLAINHPMLVAWNAYKESEEYTNSKRWAQYPLHLEGSLWTMFVAGWNAHHASTQTGD